MKNFFVLLFLAFVVIMSGFGCRNGTVPTTPAPTYTPVIQPVEHSIRIVLKGYINNSNGETLEVTGWKVFLSYNKYTTGTEPSEPQMYFEATASTYSISITPNEYVWASVKSLSGADFLVIEVYRDNVYLEGMAISPGNVLEFYKDYWDPNSSQNYPGKG
jgi:hypothetical protein